MDVPVQETICHNLFFGLRRMSKAFIFGGQSHKHLTNKDILIYNLVCSIDFFLPFLQVFYNQLG